MRRLNALVIAFFMAFGLLIQGALPALGCSCAMPNPYSGLAQADGAFVGTLVDVDEIVGPIFDSGTMIDFYFDVEASLKGDIGESVVVQAAASGASCGIEMPVGTRAGLLLYRVGGGWEGSLCSTMDADSLLAAAKGLPDPVAGSPPHLIVVAEMGSAGLVAIDRQGQIVGYGEGSIPWLVSACPAGQTFIGSTSDTTIKVWSFSDLGVVAEHELDTTGGSWMNGLICTGEAGNSFLAIKILSGVEQSNLVRYADGAVEVVAENIERLLDTALGPLAIGSDGTVYRVDSASGALSPVSEAIGDLRGQIVAAVPSPDGSHIALSALDYDQNPIDGRVWVIDLEQGTNARADFACDIYPTWTDDETISFMDSCTSEEQLFYNTDLAAVEDRPIPDYAYASYVTDESGAIFYPSEFAIDVVEPGTATGTELTRLFTYPGTLLLVPPSARSEWKGPVFTPTPIVDSPPTTFVETAAPGVPGTDSADPETSVWLLIFGAAAAGGGLWILLRRPGEPQTSKSSHETV